MWKVAKSIKSSVSKTTALTTWWRANPADASLSATRLACTVRITPEKRPTCVITFCNVESGGQDSRVGKILSIDLIGTLADKYRNEPTDINFFALAGALAGLKAPISGSNNEKDFRTYAQTVGFRETAELYEAISLKR